MKQKHLFLFFWLMVLALPTYAQNKIGDNPTVIQSGSLLELESLTKGLRLPRIKLNDVNTWTLDGTPVSGMVVFNDSGTAAKGIYYWNMDLSQWVQIVISANNGLTVTNGNVILGGALTGATTIVTDANNTLAITGLQAGANTDNVIVSNAGVLKAISPTALSISGDVSGILGGVSVDKLKGASLSYSGLSDEDLLQYNKEHHVWINVSPSTLGTIGLTVGTGDATQTDIGVSGSPASLGGSIELTIPDASTTARGVVTTGTQTLGGDKTFAGNTKVSDGNAFTVGTGATTLGGSLSITGTTSLGDNTTLASGTKMFFTGTAADASARKTSSFTAGAQAADIAYTLPTVAPSVGQVLTSTDANGVLSWTSSLSNITLPINNLIAATATNGIDNKNFGQTWNWNTLADGSGLSLGASTTAATSNTQTLLNVSLSGTNSATGQTTYGAQIANSHDGSGTNVGLSVTAKNGTNNYALLVPSGNVGIGTTTPTATLHTLTSGVDLTASSTGNLFSNTSTSSVASINKTGVDIQSTGGWSGTSAINTGLNVAVSGGTINYAALFNGGNVGIGTSTPSELLSLGGDVARTIWMERNTTTNTDGQALTLWSGGATLGGTDRAGGDLLLKSGISTGVGSSAIHFYTAAAGITGIADNTPTEKMIILGSGNVGIGITTPGSLLTVGAGATSLGGTLAVTGTTALNADLTLASGTKMFFTGTAADASARKTSSFTAGAQAADIAYTLPTVAPAVGQVLTSTDANGVLSWATPSTHSIGFTVPTDYYQAATGNTVFPSSSAAYTDGTIIIFQDFEAVKVRYSVSGVKDGDVVTATPKSANFGDSMSIAKVSVPANDKVEVIIVNNSNAQVSMDHLNMAFSYVSN